IWPSRRSASRASARVASALRLVGAGERWPMAAPYGARWGPVRPGSGPGARAGLGVHLPGAAFALEVEPLGAGLALDVEVDGHDGDIAVDGHEGHVAPGHPLEPAGAFGHGLLALRGAAPARAF